jgi:hypothetical protein
LLTTIFGPFSSAAPDKAGKWRRYLLSIPAYCGADIGGFPVKLFALLKELFDFVPKFFGFLFGFTTPAGAIFVATIAVPVGPTINTFCHCLSLQ